MSTKFAVRPAPRKKPWVCKRSPPCLIPDPVPLSLLCTYDVKILTGPAAGQHHWGTFLMPWTFSGWEFKGKDPNPAMAFEIVWEYHPATNRADGHADYGAPPYTNQGDWTNTVRQPPPNLLWSDYILIDTIWATNGFCLVSS